MQHHSQHKISYVSHGKTEELSSASGTYRGVKAENRRIVDKLAALPVTGAHAAYR